MTAPRISVCIPTYNGERWIEATLRSVLSQDEDMEVIVSDDRSTDATVEIARSVPDPRVRVITTERHLGMARNWNRAVELSGGDYVKLLMQDDELLPESLARQAALLDGHASAGFVFGPRLLEGDGSAEAVRWMSRFEAPHAALGTLDTLTPGNEVAEALTRGRLRANAIGEPSVVLLRRTDLARTGLFNLHLRQLTDLDLWIRMACISDVAFDERPVARFRVHSASASSRNRQTAADWLDRLWVIDGLAGRGAAGPRITTVHYAAALAAGGIELAMALARRRRSVAAATRDVRIFLAERAAT